MPVDEEGQEKGMQAPPTTTPQIPGGGPGQLLPGILPGDAVFKPPLPPGVRGRERWEIVKRSQPGMFAGPAAYQAWLRSLPDDPTDPEYQAELDKAKKLFLIDDPRPKSREGSNPGENIPSFEEAIKRFNEFSAAGAATHVTPPGIDSGARGPTMQSAGGPVKAPENVQPLTPEDEKRLTREREEQKRTWSRAVFRGRPVGSDELYQPQGPQDAYLQSFLTENGIALPGDDRNTALRSGKYVYMGSERNAELNVSRDVYMYEEDAKAQGMKVESNVIGQYQKALGLTVTGKMDPYLLSKWDEAVSQAQRSAMVGDKVSVREWFDILMSSVIAQKKASGGGGAGGGAQMEEMDYYRAMMAVLGDISGVDNG